MHVSLPEITQALILHGQSRLVHSCARNHEALLSNIRIQTIGGIRICKYLGQEAATVADKWPLPVCMNKFRLEGRGYFN